MQHINGGSALVGGAILVNKRSGQMAKHMKLDGIAGLAWVC